MKRAPLVEQVYILEKEKKQLIIFNKSFFERVPLSDNIFRDN